MSLNVEWMWYWWYQLLRSTPWSKNTPTNKKIWRGIFNRFFAVFLSAYIIQVLPVIFPLKWFYSEISFLYYILCTVIFHRCSPWWYHQMETFSVLLTLCAGNSLVTSEFPSQRPVTPSVDNFFDIWLNKWLYKQWRHWLFEMPSHSLWRHCNALLFLLISYI